jgi:hypothetical protein
MLQTQKTHVQGASINAYMFRLSKEEAEQEPVTYPSHN